MGVKRGRKGKVNDGVKSMRRKIRGKLKENPIGNMIMAGRRSNNVPEKCETEAPIHGGAEP